MGVPNLKKSTHKKSVIGWPKVIFAKQCKEEKECEENVCMYINYIYVRTGVLKVD